jgi:hypothetical protein
MGTSAHSELACALSSTGDLHSVKWSDTTSQRRPATKLDFVRSIALLRPRQERCLSLSLLPANP